MRRGIENPDNIVSSLVGTTAYNLTQKCHTLYCPPFLLDVGPHEDTLLNEYLFRNCWGNYNLSTPDGTIYYYLENRRVTEHFVDESGAKSRHQLAFTQGNQLVVDSENYVYTVAKALPKIYQAGEKPISSKAGLKAKPSQQH